MKRKHLFRLIMLVLCTSPYLGYSQEVAESSLSVQNVSITSNPGSTTTTGTRIIDQKKEVFKESWDHYKPGVVTLSIRASVTGFGTMGSSIYTSINSTSNAGIIIGEWGIKEDGSPYYDPVSARVMDFTKVGKTHPAVNLSSALKKADGINAGTWSWNGYGNLTLTGYAWYSETTRSLSFPPAITATRGGQWKSTGTQTHNISNTTGSWSVQLNDRNVIICPKDSCNDIVTHE